MLVFHFTDLTISSFEAVDDINIINMILALSGEYPIFALAFTSPHKVVRSERWVVDVSFLLNDQHRISF